MYHPKTSQPSLSLDQRWRAGTGRHASPTANLANGAGCWGSSDCHSTGCYFFENLIATDCWIFPGAMACSNAIGYEGRGRETLSSSLAFPSPVRSILLQAGGPLPFWTCRLRRLSCQYASTASHRHHHWSRLTSSQGFNSGGGAEARSSLHA